jgi:hypothetical protein
MRGPCRSVMTYGFTPSSSHSTPKGDCSQSVRPVVVGLPDPSGVLVAKPRYEKADRKVNATWFKRGVQVQRHPLEMMTGCADGVAPIGLGLRRRCGAYVGWPIQAPGPISVLCGREPARRPHKVIAATRSRHSALRNGRPESIQSSAEMA